MGSFVNSIEIEDIPTIAFAYYQELDLSISPVAALEELVEP